MANQERAHETQDEPNDEEVAAGTLGQAASKLSVGFINHMEETASGLCTPEIPAKSLAGGLPAAPTSEESAPSA